MNDGRGSLVGILINRVDFRGFPYHHSKRGPDTYAHKSVGCVTLTKDPVQPWCSRSQRNARLSTIKNDVNLSSLQHA